MTQEMTDDASNSRIPAASRAVLESLHTENRASAARLRACHRLYEICEDEHYDQLFAAGYDPEFDDRKDYAVVDPYDVASSEIVAAYGVHLHRARAILTLGRTLVQNFPAILEAMESGWLDERVAEMLVKQMRTVSAVHRGAVQEDVINWLLAAIKSGRRPGRSAILNKTDSIIGKHDPDGVLHRREAAFNARNVQLRRSLDGMSVLRAQLSSVEASAIFSLLQNAAREQIAAERAARAEAARSGVEVDHSDGRTLDQHRADALVDAFLGPRSPDTAADTADDDDDDDDDDAATTERSSAGRLAPQIRPLITVFAPLGPDGEPEVYLPRGGQAAIDALIALLARSVGASISVPDTAPGSADSPLGARRYRISTELARRIRLRDGTCRHPGCSVPAEDCDVDHIRPFNLTDPGGGGWTVESNLMCLCRRHHRFKTFHNWDYQLSRDGTLSVTTSTGHTITTDPDGPLTRWRQKMTEDSSSGDDPLGDSTPTRQSSPWGPDPEPQPTHWLQRAKRLAAERRANSAARNAPPPDKPDGVTDPDPPPF